MSHLLDATIYVTMGFGLGFIFGGFVSCVTDCWENTTKTPKNPGTVDTPETHPQEECNDEERSVSEQSDEVVIIPITPTTCEVSHESLEPFEKQDLLPDEDTPVFTRDLVNSIAEMLDNLPTKSDCDLNHIPDGVSELSDDELREYAYKRGVSRACKKRETILKRLGAL